jgi:hypothetical protein
MTPGLIATGVLGVIVAAAAVWSPAAGAADSADSILYEAFDLGGERSEAAQYYRMESTLLTYAADGSLRSTDVFRLGLEYLTAGLAGGEDAEIKCLFFTVQLADSSEVDIPGLKNWSYAFKQTGMDEMGQIFGIDHSKFENLVDSNGDVLPPHKTYHVYNAFVDFHSFCDVFAEPAPEDKGVQDLEMIGDTIVHAAAFSEPPVNLGSNVMEGSFFRNGRITLAFKGLSVVNGRPCALIEYDSGESSFRMKVRPMPGLEVDTVGSSHYRGDIHKDLESNWVQMVTLSEMVVSETTLPMPPDKINTVNERTIVILNISEDEAMPE